MKKKLLYLIFFLSLLGLCTVTVEAKEIAPNDIEGNSYVIGTHIFTGNTTLTTSHIMLAAKTIEGDSIDGMVIYYKKPRGGWINGATGESVTLPESFKINYTDLKLEEDNDTVSAPKEPIVELRALRFLEGTNSVNMIFEILIDDIEDKTNVVDGINFYLSVLEPNKVPITEKLVNKQNIVATRDGKDYHIIQYIFDCAIDSQINFSVSSYAEDANGKTTYSSFISNTIFAHDVVNQYVDIIETGPTAEIEDFKVYKLGITIPDDYIFTRDKSRFGYNVYEKTESSCDKLVGSFGLDEEFTVIVEMNSVKEYYAEIGYYNDDGEFQVGSGCIDDSDYKLFTIDTRTLTAPILTKLSQQVQVNDEFYEKQDETTLDSQVEGYEIYRVYDELGTNLAPGYIPMYELVNDHNSSFANVELSSGFGYYVARVYATNKEGKRVYSDFSNFVSLVVAPKITASEVVDGKVTITIENIDKYQKNSGIIFKLYSSDYPEHKEDELVSKVYESDEDATFEISVDKNMTIHAFAAIRDSIYSTDEEDIYSYSNRGESYSIIDIVVE